MKTFALSAAFFLCLGVMLFMTAADDTDQRRAEAQMAARIFTKYPDPSIAQMAPPIKQN